MEHHQPDDLASDVDEAGKNFIRVNLLQNFILSPKIAIIHCRFRSKPEMVAIAQW